jgi:LysM repeat protein
MLLSKNVLNRFFLFVCISLSANTLSKAEICDSIGVERKDGKLFILHRITAGETLYSLSKKYNVSVDELKKTNPETAQGLQVGQILKVQTALPASPAATATTLESAKTHTVAAGETLYSIATRYGVSVDALKKANPGLSNSISVGQALNLPGKAGTTTAAPAKPAVPATTTAPTPAPLNKETIEHRVASGETLYSIAKKYSVSVEDIKKANPGIGALRVGQVVKVAGAETAAATPASAATAPVKPATPVTPAATSPATPTKPAAANVEADTIQLQQDKVRLETMTPAPPAKTVPATDFKKITENGYADVMSDNQDTPKYLAYHKTAPVGTIIQLLNESNGIKVYVRVVGKLTDTGIDGKTIIRISKKAYDRLGGTGARFSATLMYIP